MIIGEASGADVEAARFANPEATRGGERKRVRLSGRRLGRGDHRSTAMRTEQPE